jgi:DNA helicase-4
MYEWRLELLFKYASNDLSKWQNAIWSKIQMYDGNWGTITYVDNNQFIMDVHKKDIHINICGKIVQISWHELHYNFKDIEFSSILLKNLHEYFNSQNCDVYLNPRSYKLLEEEYQNFEQQDQIEQISLDEEVIESIEFDLFNDDDIYSDEKNKIEQISSDEATIERIESDLLNSDDYLYSDGYERESSQDDYYQREYLEEEEELDDYSRDASYLLSELEALLSGFEFYEADHYYYYECSEYLSYEAYQNKRNHFLQNLRQSLFSQLENLFIQDDYKNADKFHEDDCSEHINIEEYQQIKRLFLEKKRTSLLEELNQLLEKNFLEANDFYQNQCIPFISQVEYQQKKQIFIQSWVQKNNLGNKPDLEQSLAIGTVNNHVQVIARAGSGKTSTLVNRAIFLQKHCGVHSSEILLLVFNRKAAQEITNRLKKYLPNDMPHVMTFHALAYAIVHPTENLLFNAPNGGQDQSRALQSVIDDYLRDPNYYGEIKTLMMKRFKEDWSKIIHQGFDKSPEEVIAFRRALPEMGIDGKYYKSYGEKVIADFLFEHNIQFAYERHVWWDGINYHPDFTIFSNTSDKKGVVIEYFGMKGDPDYDDMSVKKRRFWQNDLEWDFIELDPQILREEGRESFDNFLKSTLQEIMRVEFNRLSDEQIWLKIKDRAVDRFTKAMVSLMQRSRKLCLTPDQLSERIDRHQLNDSEVGEIEWRFLNLGQDFYKSYLERLEQTGEEDFDGLMQRASQILNDGVTQFKRKSESGDLKLLKHIMIDEYQDFSLLFYNLIQAIRYQNDEALFFCVGDDWQAINGFAGSDLYYYESFLQIFNPSQKLNIPTNYRSKTKIVEIGNKLMEGKGIAAKASTEEEGIVDIVNLAKFKLSSIEQTEYKSDSFTPAILRLLSKLIKEGKEVVLLTRKNNFKGKDIDSFLSNIIKKLKIANVQKELVTISTTHHFKGKEGQVAILLDTESYPVIHPDLLFSRIFGDSIDKTIDDERRLFYVAVTRAKEHLFIVIDGNTMPPFVEELTKRIKIPAFNWLLYPAPIDEIRYITIKIANQANVKKAGTFDIKDELKADGYKFGSKPSAHWYRTYFAQEILAYSSRLEFLSNSVWSSQANGIEVHFCDEQDQLLAIYSDNNGNWTCEFDNCPQLKLDSQNSSS